MLAWEEETASTPRPNHVPSLVSVSHDTTASPRPLLTEDVDALESGTASTNGDHSSSPSLLPWTDAEVDDWLTDTEDVA